MMADETQGIANARDALDLVLATTLVLAKQVIEHVVEHELSYAAMDDVLDAGGYEWALKASYGFGHSFVAVEGTPRTTGGVSVLVSFDELAAIMGGQQAAFRCNVPRAWIEAASRAGETLTG